MLANVCTLFPFLSLISNESDHVKLNYNFAISTQWVNQSDIKSIAKYYSIMLVFLVKRNFNRSALFLLNDQKDEPKLEPAIVPEALLSDLCFGSDLFFFTFFTRAHIRFPNVSLSSSSSFFNLIRLSTLAALCCFCCYSISTHVLTFLFLRELFTCVCVWKLSLHFDEGIVWYLAMCH